LIVSFLISSLYSEGVMIIGEMDLFVMY